MDGPWYPPLILRSSSGLFSKRKDGLVKPLCRSSKYASSSPSYTVVHPKQGFRSRDTCRALFISVMEGVPGICGCPVDPRLCCGQESRLRPMCFRPTVYYFRHFSPVSCRQMKTEIIVLFLFFSLPFWLASGILSLRFVFNPPGRFRPDQCHSPKEAFLHGTRI